MEVDDMIAAINAVHDPSTSNADRLKYTQMIEGFKEGPVDLVVEKLFDIISRSSLLIQYTSWTLIEDVIRYKWNLIATNIRLDLRNRVFHAIDIQVSEETIECCARCVVAMMEHEWPQNWPELNSELLEMSERGPLFCAIVFAIERRLIENVATLASISCQRRRREMHNAMFDSTNEFLTLALNKLESCQLDEMGTLAARNIIGWLTELYSCSSYATYEEQLTRIVDIVIRYLTTAQRNIYEHAAYCLATLSDRKREKQEKAAVISAFFREQVLSTILSTISLAADGSPFSERHYRYLKSLCKLLTTLGNFLSRVWTEKVPPAHFGTYMSTIVAFFKHDSLYLKHESCDVLLALSSHPFFRNNEDVVKSIRAVFSNTPNAFKKDGYPSQNPPTPASRFSQIDFDDDLEWHNLFSRILVSGFRSRLQLLIAENIDDYFPHLLSIHEENVLKQILLNPHQVTESEWEALIKFAKSVVTVAYDRKITGSEHNRLIQMRDALVSSMMGIFDHEVLNQMFSLHSPFLCSYDGDWNNLFNYFALLRKVLIASAGHKTLNRHVISLILRLVQTFPTYFKEKVADVISLYSDVNDVITKMQMAQLLQVLAVLSNIVDSSSVQFELLQMAAGPAIEYIRSVEWSFENIASFISFNALNTAPPTKFDSSVTLNRTELRRALTCLQGVLQQVTSYNPFASMVTTVFPSFLKLARCLIDLHLEHANAMLHPLYRDSITKIVASERQQIYCSLGENVEIIGSPPVTEVDLVSVERQYIHDLNEQVLTLISLSVNKFPVVIYSMNEMPHLLNSIVLNLSVLPEFRIRSWIKKGWKSLITCCPPEYWPLLKGFFTPIAEFMHNQLQKMWSEVSNIDYDCEPTEEQLFFEHLTCVLSRDYIIFLRACYLTNEGDDKKSRSISTLGHWLFNNNVGLYSVIMTAFSCLTFRDSLLALKAINLCKSLSEKLVDCYDDDVGVHMLVCSIRSLQLHGSDEVAGTPLMGLVFHIYFILRRFSMSFPQVLLQLPDVDTETVTNFDNKIQAMISGEELVLEKHKKEMTRKLFKGVISLTIGEQHRKPVYLRPLPPIDKRRRIVDETDGFENLAILFADGRE